MSSFKITTQSTISKARTGLLTLPHGKIETPCFMPDATYGYIRSLPFFIFKNKCSKSASTTQMFVTNALHTYVQIGLDRIEKCRGIHKFMGWDEPILSDSGGFQVYSIGIKQNAKITEEAIVFKIPTNGQIVKFTPELSMHIQNILNTDIRTVLDNFSQPDSDADTADESVRINTLWAQRAKIEWEKKSRKSLIAAVVQGDRNLKAREKSYKQLSDIGFDGYNYGGWPIFDGNLDEPTLEYFSTLTADRHPKFRYAMGIGTPNDIIKCVKLGFDLFDAVLPTRNARHGYFFTSQGILRIHNADYANDLTPIDPECDCWTCANHHRAYIRYLFKQKDPVAYILATIHNLRYYENFMRDIRNSIKKDTL